MLRYLFIPILIVGCVQPAIKRPTTTLPEQDPLQGANRLEHYLSSLNEMCSENPQRISSLIEVGYQDLARIGPREPMLDTVNDLHLIALTGHLRMKKQIDCSALISSYFFLRVQQAVSAEDATNGLIETYAQLRPSELSGNPYKFVTATALNVRLQPSTTSPILGKLARGDSIREIDRRGKWAKVIVNRDTAWVHSDFIGTSRDVKIVEIEEQKDAEPKLSREQQLWANEIAKGCNSRKAIFKKDWMWGWELTLTTPRAHSVRIKALFPQDHNKIARELEKIGAGDPVYYATYLRHVKACK